MAVLLLAALYFCYLVLKPFLVIILAAAILVSIFYPIYERLSKKLGYRQSLASLIMVVLIALLIIIPLTNFLIYLSQKSLDAYLAVRESVESGSLREWQEQLFNKYSWLNVDWLDLEEYLIAVSLKIRDVLFYDVLPL